MPLTPAAPKRKQIVLSSPRRPGGCFALVLALEFSTSGLGRPEDVEHALRLAHLASLPRLAEPDRRDPDPDPLRHIS